MTDPIEAHSPKRVVPFYRRWHFWLTALAMLATLYGGWRWMVTPHVNPHPQMKVVVRGVFPYERGWELRIRRDFSTRNRLCEITARAFLIFPMANVARETSIEIPVVREGDDNRYTFTYYEDHFVPGLCEWAGRFTSFGIFQDGKNLQGGAILGLNRQYNQITYECHFIDTEVRSIQGIQVQRGVVCSGNVDRSFDPSRADNEVNFTWMNKVLYTRIVSPGHSETIWKEGDEE
jgi:hypothetical protein